MPDTIEAAAVLALLVVPGFLAFYIAREVSPNLPHDVTDAELLLTSVGFATLLLAFELLLLAVLTAIRPDLALFAGATANELRSDGFKDTLSDHPSRVIAVSSLLFLGHCAFVCLLGWKNPLERFLQRSRRTRGYNAIDPWTLGLNGLQKEFQAQATWVRATLTDGVVYTGYLSKISNRPRDDGTRDLVLQSFTRSASGSGVALPLNPAAPERTVVALNTKDIVSIEGAFVDPYPATTA